MIEKFKIQKLTDQQQELLSIADWAWNSHWWIEHSPGYCKCKWCGQQYTSEIGINSNYPLCKKNPAIQKFIISAFAGPEKTPASDA